MKRRNFFKGVIGAVGATPAMAKHLTKAKPKTRTTGPFRVGDIVRYVCTPNKFLASTRDKYRGAIAIITDVSKPGNKPTYSIGEIDEMPYIAWYEQEELELLEAVEDRLQDYGPLRYKK